MEHTVAHLLPDEPLLLHLQAGDTIIFDDLAGSAAAIKDQIARLGFGDSYFVDGVEEPHNHSKVSPRQE
jgi:hypothetical protein